jgi:hypothetical protein
MQAMQNPVEARALNLTTSVLQPLLGNLSSVLLLSCRCSPCACSRRSAGACRGVAVRTRCPTRR